MAEQDRIIALYWNKFTRQLCEHPELNTEHMSELELRNFNARIGRGDPFLVYIPGKRVVRRLERALNRAKKQK